MKIEKFRLAFVILSLSLIVVGCNFFPEPTSLIQAPKQGNQRNQIADNLGELVKGFLPKGTSLAVPNEPVGTESILIADITNDGIDELIAYYNSYIRADHAGVIVLQQENNQWREMVNIAGTGYENSWGHVVDITGDGVPELLLGSKIGVTAGNILDIYSWRNNELIKLFQLNYHELDLIYTDNIYRLAVWKRNDTDIYDVDILKWKDNHFVSDFELYPSYFLKVASYYESRAAAVPDTSTYWYYLADSLLKAKNPVSALDAINKGMTLKITSPSYESFLSLKERIEKIINDQNQADYHYYDPHADLTIFIPKELLPYMVIESEEGSYNEYLIHAYMKNSLEKQLVFEIEVHARDFIVLEDFPLKIIAETDQLIYGIRRTNEWSKKLLPVDIVEEMISTIRVGSPFTKYSSVDDELLIKKVFEASQKCLYVSTGGKMESGLIDTFTVNGLEYRFFGSDLDTTEKLEDYLSDLFTKEAIQSLIESSKIIEKDGKLAQPNADRGSLLNYQKLSILQMKDLGSEKQYDLRVPLGNSLSYEVIHLVFKKTEEGWRISSNPNSL